MTLGGFRAVHSSPAAAGAQAGPASVYGCPGVHGSGRAGAPGDGAWIADTRHYRVVGPMLASSSSR
ncbi:hypothetical protein [Lysobacter gummosus]|uniref:hypothetical protein n=1 Tax=Lysobacter gummosus TaxID=262324 RepID=UPI003642B348